MSRTALGYETIQPSESDCKLALSSSRVLSKYLDNEQTQPIRIISDDKTSDIISIPNTAFRLLIDILREMAKGNTIKVTSINAELSTQQAADLLNVSRPFVIQLIESKLLPARKVGSHRRILLQDLILYKNNIDAERQKVLDQLVAQAQELNMGYE